MNRNPILGLAIAGLFLSASCQAKAGPVTAGLVNWLEANAGVTADGSGNVSLWADQSGQGKKSNCDAHIVRRVFEHDLLAAQRVRPGYLPFRRRSGTKIGLAGHEGLEKTARHSIHPLMAAFHR